MMISKILTPSHKYGKVAYFERRVGSFQRNLVIILSIGTACQKFLIDTALVKQSVVILNVEQDNTSTSSSS
eukprot:Ihof_evm2s567 gene=Ihof_evmTU2s567